MQAFSVKSHTLRVMRLDRAGRQDNIDLINHINMEETMDVDVVTELDGQDLDYLIRVATIAYEQGQSLSITQEKSGVVRISRGGGIWVGPFGRAATTQEF